VVFIRASAAKISLFDPIRVSNCMAADHLRLTIPYGSSPGQECSRASGTFEATQIPLRFALEKHFGDCA